MRRPVLPELAAEIARSGRTRRDIAQQVGVHPNTISSVINGLIRPTPDLRGRIAAAMHRPEHELFGEQVSA